MLLDGLVDHLVLTGIAVGVGFLLSLGLVLLIVRSRRPRGPDHRDRGRAVHDPQPGPVRRPPVPVTGLSLLSAEIASSRISLLIQVRTSWPGWTGSRRTILEAADGMGHTRLHGLLGVELPLALPLVIAGLRIATVTTIGWSWSRPSRPGRAGQ